MELSRLERLLREDEGPKLDFKECWINLSADTTKAELAKDVAAIANTKGGRGYIIFGVRDGDKEVVGIYPKRKDEEAIQQSVNSRIDPPVPIKVDFVKYRSQVLGVLTIFKSLNAPHQLLNSGNFPIRSGSISRHARRDEIFRLFQENGLHSYETFVERQSAMNDLSQTQLQDYLKSLGFIGKRPNEEILEGLGIIGKEEGSGKYKPTIGGLLLFGKDPSQILPHVYIEIIENNDKKFLYGNIPTLMQNAESYLKTKVSGSYPIEALKAAIGNALVHRDYIDSTRGIIIKISNKSINIVNPGALSHGNFVYNVSQDIYPKRRNPWLYQKLLTMDKGNYSLGFNLNRIKYAVKSAKFINLGKDELFKVILPRDAGNAK